MTSNQIHELNEKLEAIEINKGLSICFEFFVFQIHTNIIVFFFYVDKLFKRRKSFKDVQQDVD